MRNDWLLEMENKYHQFQQTEACQYTDTACLQSKATFEMSDFLFEHYFL